MRVHVLPSGLIHTNAYLLTPAGGGQAVLIDAPGEVWGKVAPILERERSSLGSLWLTHGHWDHTQGAAEVVRRTGARVVAHRDDRVLLETPGIMLEIAGPGLELEPVRVDLWAEDGQALEALGQKVRVGHVPGHCPGSLMFYFADEASLFSGDVLFRGAVGRTDLPGGSFEDLERSIRTKIYSLPDETRVFPGHGGPTTVGEEKADNPYVNG